MRRGRQVLLLKVGVWALGLYPLAQVGWWLREGLYGLGANPIEKVLLHSGWWTLVLLMATLAVTPVRRLTGWSAVIKVRRPLGLFAFFWATIHFGIYLGLDRVFEWPYIVEDLAERPFITVGFAAWIILLSLAFTSTRGWIRRLGKGWTWLHRGVYLAGLLGVVHYYWKVKADTREPLVFAAIFLALMAVRLWWLTRRRRTRQRSARADGPGTEGHRRRRARASDATEGGGEAAGAVEKAGAGAGAG